MFYTLFVDFIEEFPIQTKTEHPIFNEGRFYSLQIIDIVFELHVIRSLNWYSLFERLFLVDALHKQQLNLQTIFVSMEFVKRIFVVWKFLRDANGEEAEISHFYNIFVRSNR